MGLAFARHGARVAFTWSKSAEDAAEAQAAIRAAGGAEPLSFQGSVADAAHADRTVKELLHAWGGIDVLVNAAARNQVMPVALIEESDWDQVLDVTVKGAFLFSRAALRPMIKARRGHILNVGAFSSERVIESPVHFAAAKSALRGMTEALAREVGRYDVQVNLLAPGLMESGITRTLPRHRLEEYRAQCALGRLAGLDEVAELAAFLVSDENRFMSGAKLAADGGL